MPSGNTGAKVEGAPDLGTVAAELHAGRERFLALVADIRPELHRYVRA
jgi:hypothetical protein